MLKSAEQSSWHMSELVYELVSECPIFVAVSVCSMCVCVCIKYNHL